jgi:lipopolysaccharide transport system permease protein
VSEVLERKRPAGAPRPPAAETRPEVTVIEPPGRVSLRLRELWGHRELAWFLVVRIVKPRYRQTLLGFGWAVLPPLAMMVVFSVFFNRVAGVPSQEGIPYPIFSYSGLLVWQLFASGATRGAGSLLANTGFVTKVYFPRLLLPLTAVLAPLFDLAIAFVVLFPLMAYYGVYPGWQVAFLPVFVLLALATALAVSLWFSASSVRFRDLNLGIPLVVQLWLFATPIIYPSSIFPEGLQTVLSIVNPMVPVVEGFRWSLIGGAAPGWETAGGAALAVVALVIGAFFFDRMERTYADVI